MIKRLVVIAFAFAAFGCQTGPYVPYAREVKKKPQTGGMIALKTNHNDEDRAKADTLMKSNCGEMPIKVLEEGEVDVGQTTTGDATQTHHNSTPGQQVGTLFGIPVTSGGSQASNNTQSTTTTTALKEWQISYECTQAAKKTTR